MFKIDVQTSWSGLKKCYADEIPIKKFDENLISFYPHQQNIQC